MFRVKFFQLDGKSFDSVQFERYEQADQFHEKMMEVGHHRVFTGSQIEEKVQGIGWVVAQEPDDYEPNYCSKCDTYANPDCWCGALTGFSPVE